MGSEIAMMMCRRKMSLEARAVLADAIPPLIRTGQNPAGDVHSPKLRPAHRV
jgi:hypothetical protein